MRLRIRRGRERSAGEGGAQGGVSGGDRGDCGGGGGGRRGGVGGGGGGAGAGSVVWHEEAPWRTWSRRAESQSASFRSAGTPIMGGGDEGPQGTASDAVCLCLLADPRPERGGPPG